MLLAATATVIPALTEAMSSACRGRHELNIAINMIMRGGKASTKDNEMGLATASETGTSDLQYSTSAARVKAF